MELLTDSHCFTILDRESLVGVGLPTIITGDLKLSYCFVALYVSWKKKEKVMAIQKWLSN